MSIVYREDKGSPLSGAEVDENFRYLDDKLKQLEKTQVQFPEFDVSDGCLIVKNNRGEVLTQLKLPRYETKDGAIMPVYAGEDVPSKKIPGQMAFLSEKDVLFPIYCDGQHWRNFSNHSIIKEKK